MNEFGYHPDSTVYSALLKVLTEVYGDMKAAYTILGQLPQMLANEKYQTKHVRSQSNPLLLYADLKPSENRKRFYQTTSELRNRFRFTFPGRDVGIEEDCPECREPMHDMYVCILFCTFFFFCHIRLGWNETDHDATTKCPKCGHRFTAKIVVKESEEYQVWLDSQPTTKLELFALRKDTSCFVKQVIKSVQHGTPLKKPSGMSFENLLSRGAAVSSLIQPGDQLVAINGHDVTSMRMEQIQECLLKPPLYTEELQTHMNLFATDVTSTNEHGAPTETQTTRPDNAHIFESSENVWESETHAKTKQTSKLAEESVQQHQHTDSLEVDNADNQIKAREHSISSSRSSTHHLPTEKTEPDQGKTDTNKIQKKKKKRRFLFRIGGRDKNKTDGANEQKSDMSNTNICLTFRVKFLKKKQNVKYTSAQNFFFFFFFVFYGNNTLMIREWHSQAGTTNPNLNLISNLTPTSTSTNQTNDIEQTDSTTVTAKDNTLRQSEVSSTGSSAVIVTGPQNLTNDHFVSVPPTQIQQQTTPQDTALAGTTPTLKEIMLLCGVDAISNVEFRTKYPQLFWNLVWHFSNLRLPLYFLEGAFDDSKEIQFEKIQGTNYFNKIFSNIPRSQTDLMFVVTALEGTGLHERKHSISASARSLSASKSAETQE
ncbi:hypothetical protein RFI_23137 [Reticulomyxa filosa]|uniref:PDZ domain-containing protein n=1 Tax=Reticulomyxa filosa TaxID=46433 RepID=X6MMC2_RETFI|nr:hypothetical protein RFI_23137 [Reticulomyxa filosa]|eukprot:ETO14235.1 hypothetical protein RFI_23137 [Reticulomyxa filosa]